MNTEPRGLLFDMTRCWGCRNCVEACIAEHDFERDAEQTTELAADAFTAMKEVDDLPVRNLCRHCVTPSCASVCPVGALQKTELGPVVYDASKCMGCRYCMVSCPFDIPRYEWHATVPKIRKCDMCIGRMEKGELPACAEACPADATTAGTRAELIAEAHRRIAESPGDYLDHVYGEHEVGGTSVLFLAPKEMPVLGYEASLGDQPLPRLTWQVLEHIPPFALTGCAVLGAFAWIVRRRDQLGQHADDGAPQSPSRST
ncbi:MAG: 4Fe-4S dicluster domain-containing protein [Planctomycetes bacterium]|nr:4Fe-4S dicluster domain-containing protein [Planctomycetota bacterium]